MRLGQSLTRFNALLFDCDGVVLNSNRIKTNAFYHAALPYGEAAAQAMVDYHVANGGVSRYKKFAHFLKEIAPDQSGPDLDALLRVYADYVREKLVTCEVAPQLAQLRERTADARWLIVSGGDQVELRDVFTVRDLAKWFDGGIFGSPDTKDDILSRELAKQNCSRNALFLGDSRYDHLAAAKAGLSFVFVSGWSEFSDWESYCDENRLPSIQALADLLELG